jgi:hypothetical protein
MKSTILNTSKFFLGLRTCLVPGSISKRVASAEDGVRAEPRDVETDGRTVEESVDIVREMS